MRVLVSGGAGFLGRAVGRSLARAGHTVRSLIHSATGAAACLADGTDPYVGDVTDPADVTTALQGCEALVHLAQGPPADLPRMRAVRVGGAEVLLRSARGAGVRRAVIGSGYWVYPGGPEPIREETPVAPRGLSLVNFDTEVAARRLGREEGVEVLILRPGMVYGNGSWFAGMVSELRQGAYRYLGDGRQRLSPVHLEDAAKGFRTVLEHGEPMKDYLVVDDMPMPQREFAEFVARELGVGPPVGIPLSDAVLAWGEDAARLEAGDRNASNARLRALGWAPRFPRYEAGVRSVLGSMAAPA